MRFFSKSFVVDNLLTPICSHFRFFIHIFASFYIHSGIETVLVWIRNEVIEFQSSVREVKNNMEV